MNKKKILVTGGSGFVGSRFIRRWDKEYNLLAPRHQVLDISDAAATTKYIKEQHPEVVVHFAALSNTWYCEQHPEESLLVNTTATIYLAKAAAEVGAKFIFFSSDQIYNGNGEQGLLHEDLAVAPVNHYGRHKLMAEQGVLQLMPDAVALRATWMYDTEREGLPTHPNFITNLHKAVSENSPLSFATHEYRGITDVNEVIEYLPLTFSLPGGVYNYGAENLRNTFDTAHEFVKWWKGEKVANAVVKEDHERFAQQTRNLSVSTAKIAAASKGKIQFTATLEGLKKFVDKG